MHRDRERVRERRGGGDADPQPGERPWPHPDHHRVEVRACRRGFGEAVEDQRGEHLRVRAGVDVYPAREHAHVRAVEPDESGGDGGGGGIDGEREHDGFTIPASLRADPFPVHRAGLGFRGTPQTHQQVPIDETLDEPGPPLDHHHRVVQVGVEIEGVEFVEHTASIEGVASVGRPPPPRR